MKDVIEQRKAQVQGLNSVLTDLEARQQGLQRVIAQIRGALEVVEEVMQASEELLNTVSLSEDTGESESGVALPNAVEESAAMTNSREAELA